ncbi:hypothetical protein MFIFM68171_05926 [Madurella fahalii]|uniref:Dynamin N-terminal domain-containing protein n=1 Tax=Madurella fahalii TaxID=1157608 RepID=A0ABQ0GDA0_9PEZI
MERDTALTALARLNSEFAWNTCSNEDIHTRVCLKQQAVDDAFVFSHKLRDPIRAALDREGPGKAAVLDLICGNELREWMDEMAKLQVKNTSLEILVGVAGVTGVGKTSLLNALLEFLGLLPSSSMEAATATVCRIAWNDDNTPGREFKADVIFRSKEDVSKELKEVLSAVKDRKELRKQDFDNEDERVEAIEEVTRIISKGIGNVCVVWGLDETDIEDTDNIVESVLGNNDAIVKLLGTKMAINSSNAEEFAADVKPYFDSTPTLEGIIAWPLIEEVRLYIKAEILKHDIVLVDLPGLSDTVGSRSAVAERYFQELSVTAIVTPAIRAVDEKTGVKLMGEYQELRMKLDGKYHKGSFCVVVSKIDDIDCDAFVKGSREARQDTQLQDDVAKIKSISVRAKEIQQQLKTAERKLQAMSRNCAKMKENIDGFKPAASGVDWLRDADRIQRGKAASLKEKRAEHMRHQRTQRRLKRKLVNDAAQLDRALETLESRKKHRCVWFRSSYFKKRIAHDFARRQKKLSRVAARDRKQYDGSVEVLPVSAAAFRDLLKDRKPMPGFPSKRYTGIPRLSQWLEEATFPHREEHLDSLLCGLQRQLHGIKRWSDDASRGAVVFSKQEVESLLKTSHEKYCNKIRAFLNSSAQEIRNFRLLRNKDEKLHSCEAVAANAARRWVYKYPENENSTLKMSWVTYQAILKRNGAPFQSAGVGRQHYDFPVSLGTPFLASLLDDWLGFFHSELPRTEETLMNNVSEIWRQYMCEVTNHIRETAPDIIPHFDDTASSVHGIEEELRDKIAYSIKAISEGASQIHPLDALKITGNGLFEKQQRQICREVRQNCRDMFLEGYTRMENEYKRRVGFLPKEFDDISRSMVRQVRIQIGLLLGNLQAVPEKNYTALGRKRRLQRAVKTLVLAWAAQWRAPNLEEGVIKVEPLNIPEEFLEGEVQDDGEYDSSDSSIGFDIEE